LLDKVKNKAAAERTEAFKEVEKAYGVWKTANAAVAMVEIATAEHSVSCSALPPKKRMCTTSSPSKNN